jgi:hypothetical protein
VLSGGDYVRNAATDNEVQSLYPTERDTFTTKVQKAIKMCRNNNKKILLTSSIERPHYSDRRICNSTAHCHRLRPPHPAVESARARRRLGCDSVRSSHRDSVAIDRPTSAPFVMTAQRKNLTSPRPSSSSEASTLDLRGAPTNAAEHGPRRAFLPWYQEWFTPPYPRDQGLLLPYMPHVFGEPHIQPLA